MKKLITEYFGKDPDSIERMPLSGSNREYYKVICNGETIVATVGKEIAENEAFISFSEAFDNAGLNVPKILKVSENKDCYLQSFIDGISLFDFLERRRCSNGNPDNSTIELYKKTIAELPRFQIIGAKIIDFSKCYPRDSFDSQSIMWDLNYFKYYFLKATHTIFDEQLLETDFQTLAKYLTSAPSNFFLYRDFQSRNIIINHEQKPYFIDYQGGRRGALQYDIASLLFDGKAALNPNLREELLQHYINELSKYLTINEKEFRDMFTAFAYIRIMQACGSYGYRGMLEQKPHFLKSIPPAMKNIAYLVDNQKLPIHIPELEKCLKQISTNETLLKYGKSEPLIVTLMSFSYKKGIPYDPTGNGGGFIFDCRAIHNPGKYAQYQSLTGRDEAVVEFFKKEPEMYEFVKLSQQMVELSLKKYIKRGFKNLSVLFGCTGGQHRSVYAAERMAEFIEAKFPEVVVKLTHREQDRRKDC